jgi:thiamine-phosphate pyrophosphorylase
MSNRTHAISGISGIYALTPDDDDTTRLLRRVAEAIAGGIHALQYRAKLASPAKRLEQARGLKALADAAGIPLIVNDDVALALQVDAAGVHIGRDDGDPAELRRRIGTARILGVSCYDDLQRAIALAGIADYVAFGSVFASATKPAAVRAPLSLFAEAKRHGLATVAIGGIDAGNAASVFAAGADAIAVIGDIFAADDPKAAAGRLAEVARAAGVARGAGQPPR